MVFINTMVQIQKYMKNTGYIIRVIVEKQFAWKVEYSSAKFTFKIMLPFSSQE